MTDKDIRQMIDACRPGSDDLQMSELARLAEQIEKDPEIRDLFEQTQRLDAVVGKAFHEEVPMPDGLEERLLASLAWEADQPLVEPARRQNVNRRTWMWATATAGVAAAILVGAFVWMQEPPPITEGQFVEAAYGWFDEALDNGRWQEDLASADVDRRLPRALRGKPRAWQRIKTDYDSRAIVFDLAVRGGDRAMLLVTRPSVEVTNLKSIPPIDNPRTTGGQSVGAWREGDLQYILLVQGPNHRALYRSMLRPSSTVALSPRNPSPTRRTGKV